MTTEEGKLYWTLLVAIASAVWIVALFIRDRQSEAAKRSASLIDRMVEVDKLLIEHPEIQKYMSSTVAKPEEYFRDPAILEDELFFRAKSFAYLHVNLFDGLLSSARHSRTGLPLLAPPGVIEISDWEQYIRRKLSHPLYRSILNNEGEVFGAALRDFWSANKASIDPSAVSPFTW